ncbi:hypothetical protein SAMD00019534_054320 [Acytostelium subglobosum LB1]|uniref:hypothetical protein n=1 Tax=Acytostelium subglobosum LB1 TaxID=1410327 RepID=UPI000644C3F6|nr:hypothetical protein SAMD00019534_054320 [Acytostelium subglobosum LB1]GAM22257.1 hypothetical protein SAMD00019534_054320 [Acytostelium subglobosum LB1]|eukprot:XP_012754377.1 hypothetical protein SAMD00019534_054320 [Acytostelium subglobosum LB1]
MASQLKSRGGALHAPGASGNDVTIANPDEFHAAVQALHTTGNPINWILVTYNGSPNHIKLEASGRNGIHELTHHLTDDLMAYALLRVVDIVDGFPTDRYVYITWIGDNVKGMDKARYGTNKTVITKLLGHYNVEIIASSKAEISEQEIVNKVSDASGSRNRTGDTVPKHVPAPTLTSAGSANAYGSRSAQVKLPTVNTTSVGLSFIDEAGLRQLVQEVKSPQSSVNWMLIGYENKEQNLSLIGKGNGGLRELVSHLSSSKVSYGIVKVSDKIDNSVTTKVAQINWVGVNVSPMIKGKITSHKGTIDEFFAPVHVVLYGEVTDELTEDRLLAKVQALKGSTTTL